jgi:precorrin-2/cobalt-factor-2 C20-methyltransferase
MTGRLYVVGVGPGDPELLTLKAARIINGAGCICVPKGREEGASLALSIVEKAVDLTGKEIVEAYFPMVKTRGSQPGAELDAQWTGTVAAILDRLDRGIDTAFITIGDPGIYSTFFYVHERLLAERPGLSIEVVPGISSINASAARMGLPLGLGDERIAILPANYLADLDGILGRFSCVVLMKVYKVFDEVVASLTRLGLLDHAVYVSRAGMEDERVCTDLTTLKAEDLDYFSLIIVKRQKRG